MNTTTPDIPHTSLSAGRIIYRLLSEHPYIREVATQVFPVAANEAGLPYVAFRRAALEHDPAKGRGADTVVYDVRCYAATYLESVELAEAVRDALDYQTAADETTGIRMRSCYLSATEPEVSDSDAYIQTLKFTIRI